MTEGNTDQKTQTRSSMGIRFESPQYKKSAKGSMNKIAKGRETIFEMRLMSIFIY